MATIVGITLRTGITGGKTTAIADFPQIVLPVTKAKSGLLGIAMVLMDSQSIAIATTVETPIIEMATRVVLREVTPGVVATAGSKAGMDESIAKTLTAKIPIIWSGEASEVNPSAVITLPTNVISPSATATQEPPA